MNKAVIRPWLIGLMFCIGLTGLTSSASAQADKDAPGKPEGAKSLDPIAPDRPNFTNSTTITPLGHTVLEVGYRQTQTSDSTTLDYGDGATVRIPLSSAFEVRVGLPSYLVTVDGQGNGTGLGDANIGFKWLVRASTGLRKPSVAVLVTNIFPSGSSTYRETAVQPQIRAMASVGLTEKSGADVNLLAGLPSQGGNRFTQFAVSGDYTHELFAKTIGFIDAYAALPASYQGPNQSYVDIGVQRLLSNDCQVDAFFGHGLNKDGRDLFFGAGVSFRF